MQTNKVARNLRTRIGKFSGDLSKGLCVVAQRFVSEMVYGIQASQSVMLTEIARTLEEQTSIHKVEDRLSRNLRRPVPLAPGVDARGTCPSHHLIINPFFATATFFITTICTGWDTEEKYGHDITHILNRRRVPAAY